MSETKSFTIIACAFFVFASVGIYCASTEETKVNVEKEKTKQLELQLKIDSLKNHK